jgi:hypothetical protein
MRLVISLALFAVFFFFIRLVAVRAIWPLVMG